MRKTFLLVLCLLICIKPVLAADMGSEPVFYDAAACDAEADAGNCGADAAAAGEDQDAAAAGLRCSVRAGLAFSSGAEEETDGADAGNCGEQTQGREETGGDVTEPDEPAEHKHVWSEWRITRAADYFAKGSKERSCECGEVQTKTIPRKTASDMWVTCKGDKYYFAGNGKPVKNGWHLLKRSNSSDVKVWCFFRSKVLVRKITSQRSVWIRISGKKYYIDRHGKPLRGFQTIRGRLYHLGNDRSLDTGEFTVSGVTYTAAASGVIEGLSYYKYKYGTFVHVDISDQKLRFYRKGRCVLKTGIVSGQKGAHDTPAGFYTVRGKNRNVRLTGPTWNVRVNYWIPFIGGSVGFHDASWRGSWEFEDSTRYTRAGSHGCVNMPFSAAKELYELVGVGTRVIIVR